MSLCQTSSENRAMNEANFPVDWRILAVLQEAGELTVPALINTFIQPASEDSDLEPLRNALSQLLDDGTIEMALSREPATLDWLVISNHDSREILECMPQDLCWSNTGEYWEYKAGSIPTLLLTDKGFRLATRLLRQHGWKLVGK